MSSELIIEKSSLPEVSDIRLNIMRAIMYADDVCLLYTDPPIIIFVGKVDGLVVGMSEIAVLNIPKTAIPKSGEITYYVHPNQRKHRYGELLMDHAIAHVEKTLKLPVCAFVEPESYSEWLLLTRNFVDKTKLFSTQTSNRFYMRLSE